MSRELLIEKLKPMCNNFNDVQKAIDEITEEIKNSNEYNILDFLEGLYYEIIRCGDGYEETKFAFGLYKAAIQFHNTARIEN